MGIFFLMSKERTFIETWYVPDRAFLDEMHLLSPLPILSWANWLSADKC